MNYFIAKNNTIKQENIIVVTYNTMAFFATGRLSRSPDSIEAAQIADFND